MDNALKRRYPQVHVDMSTDRVEDTMIAARMRALSRGQNRVFGPRGSTWDRETRDILIVPFAKALSVATGGGSEPESRYRGGRKKEGRPATHGREWARVTRGGDGVELGGGTGARSGVSQQQNNASGTWWNTRSSGEAEQRSKQRRRDFRRRRKEGAMRRRHAASNEP
ncbi:hypothetical protein Syun_015421 [Stephania yunnanensis]|uniref:Uncharacterized protein n=1 Tax=Stephania yunnanensis TaxID=152371 RepID=A0AAP0PCT2_9MAGN